MITGLPLSVVAEAMRASWLELDAAEAIDNVEGFLERQADLARDRLHWTLADLAEGRGS